MLLVVIDFSTFGGVLSNLHVLLLEFCQLLIWMDVTVSYGWGKQVIVGDSPFRGDLLIHRGARFLFVV